MHRVAVSSFMNEFKSSYHLCPYEIERHTDFVVLVKEDSDWLLPLSRTVGLRTSPARQGGGQLCAGTKFIAQHTQPRYAACGMGAVVDKDATRACGLFLPST